MPSVSLDLSAQKGKITVNVVPGLVAPVSPDTIVARLAQDPSLPQVGAGAMTLGGPDASKLKITGKVPNILVQAAEVLTSPPSFYLRVAVGSSMIAVPVAPPVVVDPPPVDPPPATGWPNAKNTGVPSGVVLKSSIGIIVTKAGTVIESLDVKGTIAINANNVTVKNCKVTSGDFWVINIKKGVTGTVVQDCLIDNLGAGGQGINGTGRFLRNNIQNCADGININGDNSVLQDNYIHDMTASGSGAHYDGIQADGALSHLKIVHNTVINENGQTSCIMLDNYWGAIDDVTIDDNQLIGGGYTVYLNEMATQQGKPGKPMTNVFCTNNHMGRGGYGYFDIRAELGHSPSLSGNVDYKTGKPIT